MSRDALITQLKKAGWSDFSPDESLGVQFDAVGKAKTARNNWFALLKSVPTMDASGFDSWSRQYDQFSKRSRATLFKSGKYFVLILLADTIAPDMVLRLSQGFSPAFLETPPLIDRGGGYALVVVKGAAHVLMPKEIAIWDVVRANEFVTRTHQAVAHYMKMMLSQESGPGDRAISGLGTVRTEKLDFRR